MAGQPTGARRDRHESRLPARYAYALAVARGREEAGVDEAVVVSADPAKPSETDERIYYKAVAVAPPLPRGGGGPVSYTHLTLPTILLV